MCTKCQFKRVVPGTLKISSLKQKGKKKKTHYTVEAHWEKRGSTYYWIPAKKATSYEYKLYYKIRSKNAKKYIISLNPNWKASGDWMLSTKKKSFTYKFYRSTPIKKLTLYLTPVSKTDTPGKTVKRVVKFSWSVWNVTAKKITFECKLRKMQRSGYCDPLRCIFWSAESCLEKDRYVRQILAVWLIRLKAMDKSCLWQFLEEKIAVSLVFTGL